MKRANLLSWVFIASVATLTGGSAMSQTYPPIETKPEKISAALEACDAGDMEQCYVYGRAMLARERTSAEDMSAYNALEKACEGGVALACYGAGWRYIQGNNTGIDLARARQIEAKGCGAGDDRACGVLRRLDNPIPSAAKLTGFPAVMQGNVNMAIYSEPDGGERLWQYSQAPNVAENLTWVSNLMAGSCELGRAKSCQMASANFAEQPGWNGIYESDMPRARALAEVGCGLNDALSCYLAGHFWKLPDSTLTQRSREFYQKAIPDFKKLCADGGGFYCDNVAWINLQGIDENVTVGGLNFFTTVDPYQKRGCELGYKKSCDDIAAAQAEKAQNEADERERERALAQRRADEEYGYPRDSAVLQQCLLIEKEFYGELERYNRQGAKIVAGANADNASGKKQRLYWASEASCDTLLNIAERAGKAGCAGKIYNGMMEQFPKFTNLIAGRCQSRSREMGANWNIERY